MISLRAGGGFGDGGRGSSKERRIDRLCRRNSRGDLSAGGLICNAGLASSALRFLISSVIYTSLDGSFPARNEFHLEI